MSTKNVSVRMSNDGVLFDAMIESYRGLMWSHRVIGIDRHAALD